MGLMAETRESEYYDALQAAVDAALAPHGPDSASLREELGGSINWSLDITPARPGAAHAYLTHIGGDEIVMGFGGTHVYMWDDDPQELARRVELLLTAVFHGRFVEGGPRKDAFAKVETSGGPVSVGRISLPLPWKFRRKRRYSSYSA